MKAAKIHVAVVVVITLIVGLLYGHLPFFPIEISRAASSCPEALTVFRFGMLLLFVTLWWSQSMTFVTVLLWMGLSMIAVFDDNNQVGLHFVGIILVVVACTWHLAQCYESQPRNGWIALIGRFFWDHRVSLTTAIAIMGFRLALKAGVVFLFEMELKKVIYSPLSLIAETFHRSVQIMYVGAEACPNHPHIVLGVFRVAAVLQWIMFYILSTCIQNTKQSQPSKSIQYKANQ